ncbi:hypothetical protein JOM56_014643 [Amanita muscaria]
MLQLLGDIIMGLQGLLDLFLSDLFCRIQGPNSTAPKSADIPRVSESIIGNMLVRGEFASLQSYTTWYNNVVTSANPGATVLIDPAFVKMSFDIMLAWTGFCSNGEIPSSNFGDWFQWFSTVTGPATTCNLLLALVNQAIWLESCKNRL